MAKSYRQWARYLRWIVAAGLVVALAAGFVKYLDFFYHWGHSHSTGVIHARSWLIASIVVLGAVLLAVLSELFVLALPVAKGLVNERRGRSAGAAECYMQALSRYLGGGYFPFRNAARMAGVGLFGWKSAALDQTPDETIATLKDLQNAIDHLQRGPYRVLLGRSFFRDFGGVFSYLGAVDGVSEFEDIVREGGLAALEKRAETRSDDLNRGMTLYELGHYRHARASFDQATDAFERSGDADIAEVPRLLGALAAWESGDQDDCARRVRGWRPADLDLRLWVLGLRCLLASAEGKTDKALAIVERTAALVPDGSADPGALAWLATARATVLRAAGRYDDALTCARQAVDHFEQAGPTAALDSRLEVARALIGLGRRDEAVAVAARATADLDALRYQLKFTEHRFAFARGQGTARALALELASASTPRLTAELVEGARVQGLPTPRTDHTRIDPVQDDHRKQRSRPWGRASSPSGPPAAEQSTLPAGWTAVGLASLDPACRVDLFVPGDSELGRLAPDPQPTGRVVLAQVAQAVAGGEWWWWGSWAAGAQLYWSLIGHAGTVEAGAIPMASLEPVLTRLLEALPTPLAGETSGNAGRAQNGALAKPETALDLLGELGALLIPPALRHLALGRAASGQPLSLVVAPASPLGRVPFGLLGLGKPGTHLAHGAIIRLGLPAALLELARQRPPASGHGRVLSVIDPCGREMEPADRQRAESAEDKTLSLLGDRQLDEMGVTRWAWLQHSPVLSREGHLKEFATVTDHAKRATISELSRALRTTSAGVLAYIGHVRHGSDDAPANASLVLDDDDLLARDLLYPGKHRWPMPPRVALLGCGSGGAQAPEWLGLAPAAVWAGAEVVAATAWDLIGEADTWHLADEVVSILVQSPDPAAEWRQRLIDHLADWTTHDGAPSPLSWGAIQFTGIGQTGPALPA